MNCTEMRDVELAAQRGLSQLAYPPIGEASDMLFQLFGVDDSESIAKDSVLVVPMLVVDFTGND